MHAMRADCPTRHAREGPQRTTIGLKRNTDGPGIWSAFRMALDPFLEMRMYPPMLVPDSNRAGGRPANATSFWADEKWSTSPMITPLPVGRRCRTFH